MASLLDKVMMALGYLSIGKSWRYYVCSQHLPDKFPLGGDETSPIGKTYAYGVNHKFWIFFIHFREKVVKMEVITKGLAQISFTKAPRWEPLYISKSTRCVAPICG